MAQVIEYLKTILFLKLALNLTKTFLPNFN